MPLSSLFFYISLGFTTVKIENILRYASENQFKIVVETMEKAKLPNFFSWYSRMFSYFSIGRVTVIKKIFKSFMRRTDRYRERERLSEKT